MTADAERGEVERADRPLERTLLARFGGGDQLMVIFDRERTRRPVLDGHAHLPLGSLNGP